MNFAVNIDLTNLTALFLTMVVISAVPGPSDFALVARSLTADFCHALVFVAGIVLADLVFIAVAVSSLTAIAEYETPFTVVKICGAGFLVWLGLGAMKSKSGGSKSHEQSKWRSSFLSGFLITLGDPKAILFYFGLLPAYVDISEAGLGSVVAIAVVATLAICVVKLGYAALAQQAQSFFRSETAMLRMNRFAGALLILVGGYLVVQELIV